MRYSDLPENPKPGVCLWCPGCDKTVSACRADHWHVPHMRPWCNDCDEPLRLVEIRTRYVRITPAKAEARR